MKTRTVSQKKLEQFRGKRSREVIAHEMRKRGHATDAKTIWRWERGHNQPNGRFLADLADILGASSVDELYADDDEEEAAPPMAGGEDMLTVLVPRAFLNRVIADELAALGVQVPA